MMLPGEYFQISFSGLTLRFTQPHIPFGLTKAFSCLLCHDQRSPDAEYEIVLLDTPLQPSTPPMYAYNGIQLYRTEEAKASFYGKSSA
jgi:hypothetical protein